MILYTRNVCPGCDTLKRMLAADRSIPLPLEKNIDKDPAAYQRAVHVLKLQGVPALEVTDRRTGQPAVYVGAQAILVALRGS